ncbi:DNA polymerase III subunit alpha [Salibacterium aidingense]|uniref:DNA polymerase III subunit alpha n=1 Tax=Salibacterium aidingense TaxID=384933 RepID=UPI003BE60285
MEFVHLHIHTEYSLLDSTARIEALVNQASAFGMKALAVTDKDVMHGVIPFYKRCVQAGIKPIIGLELWVKGIEYKEEYPVLLLAENNKGYEELMQLSTIKQTEQAITMETTAEILNNAVLLFPFADGEAAELLRAGEADKAEAVLRAWIEKVSVSAVYMERQPAPKQENIMDEWKKIAGHLSVPLAAGLNVHAVYKEEMETRLALKAVEAGDSLKNIREQNQERTGWLLSKEDTVSLLPKDSEAVAQTSAIADRCNVAIDFNKTLLPTFPHPPDITPEQLLRERCEEGVRHRYDQASKMIKDRLDRELHIIHEMGFDDYFLIVADFVHYARQQGMLVGPGRGSAAGSLVSFVLEITDVDPLKHDLLFERFLNPERINMPDIDIDFPDYRRDEVIDYVAKQYGRYHVAQIVTFGTFGARAAVRDMGRILEAPQALIERIASFIPHGPGAGLRRTYEENGTMRSLIEKEELAASIFKLACQVEGLPRHTSIHAAGVVISDKPLYEHTPLMKKDGEVLLTQFAMDELEAVGLLKMDFLGLKNLSLLERITASIRCKEKENIELRTLPLDNQATYKMLAEGDTTGIFQLESAGMRNALRQIKPTAFEDIAAVNALYRPGPMENIPVYAERKHGGAEPAYPHEALKGILAPTYGVIVYQEQIMQIAAVMAGYSFGEADLLRRAVSKKNRNVLEEERTRFLKRAQQLGRDPGAASSVYDLIVRFADYGFNRSHAVAYSFIAYQLAYLKAHYPEHFYASLLSMHHGNTEKMGSFLREVRQKGIEIITPSINSSSIGFQAEDGTIQFGLLAVKNVNRNGARALIEERRKGRYQSFIDFLMRLDKGTISRQGIEALIKAGAFDEFGKDRAVLLASLDRAMEYAEFQKELGGLIFEGEIDFRYVDMEPFSSMEKLEAEKEVTGFYLTGHPLRRYEQVLAPFEVVSLHENLDAGRKKIWAAGILEEIRNVRTRQGQSMAFGKLTDGTANLEAVFFPSVYRYCHSLLMEQKPILVGGRPDRKSEENKLLVDEVIDLEELWSTSEDILYLKLESRHADISKAQKIKDIVKKYPGGAAVCLYYEKEGSVVQLSDTFRVSENDALLQELKQVLPEEFVVLRKHRG